MIKEFSIKAKPSSATAKILFGVLLAAAAVCVVISMAIEGYKGLVSTAALVFITSAVFVYTKYIGVEYYYDILAEGQDEPLLVVRQISGKRASTLACVALADISDIKVEADSERSAHKTPAGYRKYSYLPSISPKRSVRITLKSRHECAEILLEISDEIAELLKLYSGEAKELRRLAEGNY